MRIVPVMRDPRHVTLLAVGLGLVAAFAIIVVAGLLMTASAPWTAMEMRVVVAVNGVHNSAFDILAQAINVGLGPTFAAIVAAATMAVAGVIARSWLIALRMGLLIALPWGTADIVKIVVQRPRPDSSLLSHVIGVEPSTFSYPSGHTAFAAALGTSAILMLAAWRFRAVIFVLAVAIALVTAWSRVYLGAHYPTDVLASLLLVPLAVIAVHRFTGQAGVFEPGTATAGRIADSHAFLRGASEREHDGGGEGG